jgi:hypothetical protein
VGLSYVGYRVGVRPIAILISILITIPIIKLITIVIIITIARTIIGPTVRHNTTPIVYIIEKIRPRTYY